MDPFNFILSSNGLQNLRPRHYVKGQELKAMNGTAFNPTNAAESRKVGESFLGTPIFSNLEIKAGSYTIDNKTTNYKALKLDYILFDVSQEKHIILTNIQGRNGSIKEYISDGDFKVSIKGALFSTDQTYPEADVNTLLSICKAPQAIEVSSWYLQLFGIYNMVIEKYKLSQKIGSVNRQLFEIEAVSDMPIELLPLEEKR